MCFTELSSSAFSQSLPLPRPPWLRSAAASGPESDAARKRRQSPRVPRRWPALAPEHEFVVATGTAGIPKFSSPIVSCKLHVVHDPQSASASITASHRAHLLQHVRAARVWRTSASSRESRARRRSARQQDRFQAIQKNAAARLADVEQRNRLALQASQAAARRCAACGARSFIGFTSVIGMSALSVKSDKSPSGCRAAPRTSFQSPRKTCRPFRRPPRS